MLQHILNAHPVCTLLCTHMFLYQFVKLHVFNVILVYMLCYLSVQIDKELASGEYFLKEREKRQRKEEMKKVIILL